MKKVSDTLQKVIENYNSVIYLCLLMLVLWPVWTNKYFLTLDGPSHLYNSAVLLYCWQGKSTSFFSLFYTINPNIDPNWFSHIALASLMRFMSPLLSEKIFITFYIVCYLLFSRWLIVLINNRNKVLVFLPFLFVCHHVFQMGFYNFCFSLTWMIGTWLFFLKFKDRWRWYFFAPALAMLLLITYLAHPVGYLLACAVMVCMLFFDFIQNNFSGEQFIKQNIVLAIAILPSMLLMVSFILRRPTIDTTHHDSFSYLGDSIIHLSAIVNLVSTERTFAVAVFFVIVAVILIALIIKISSRKFDRFDAFLVAVIFSVIFYFIAPVGIAGAGTVNERLQIIPFVILPFWLASIQFPKWLSILASAICGVLFISLMLIRIPVHSLCSKAIEEYVSTSKYIAAESTVLPLNYTYNGKNTNGNQLVDRIWMFFHSADYLGTEKPLVMLGNYEANTGYFPLVWRPEVNPFKYLSENDGIEMLPPIIDIPKYEAETKLKVDYVILLCLDQQFVNDPRTIVVLKQLQANYTRVYTSQYGRAILYQRNSGDKNVSGH